MQVINGLITLPLMGVGGVAWFAHIGGFVVGYLLAKKMFRRRWY
ncbi:MAG: rhomboid family intramembrane serine protease [Aquificaceae bacterium]